MRQNTAKKAARPRQQGQNDDETSKPRPQSCQIASHAPNQGVFGGVHLLGSFPGNPAKLGAGNPLILTVQIQQAGSAYHRVADSWPCKGAWARARGQAWGRMIQPLPDEIGLCWLVLAGLAAAAGAAASG